jgi:hypothetical protein
MGCFRLGARIYDLRKDGMDIAERRVKTPGGAMVSEYWLASFQHELLGE